MKYKELRFKIPEELFIRYKHVCVDRLLSVTKQSAALIQNFVDIQEENDHRIYKGK